MKSMCGAAVLAIAVAGAGCETMNQTPPASPPASPTQPAQVLSSEPGVIPVGQQLDVRLQERLSSETARVEQRFETTTVVDLVQDGEVLVPAGSVVHGTVASVEPAGKLDRTGRLTLNFDRLSIGSRNYQIRALPMQAFESGGIREEGATVGAAGVAGAIVGGILGGVRGALIGAAVGAGGVVAATEGQDVVLPAGAIVRVRMDAPVRIQASGG
jgi:hypothetical protein